jgi:hypothetical protein
VPCFFGEHTDDESTITFLKTRGVGGVPVPGTNPIDCALSSAWIATVSNGQFEH